jgi:threonine 3-dehydrogenase
MRALVTGGSGFLGAELVRALVARGAEVTSADVVSAEETCAGVEMARCDVGQWAELLRLVSAVRPDVIFHTAGILSAAAEARPQAAYQVNAIGTFNVLEAAAALGVGQVVLTSTIATYGARAGKLVDEGTQQRPTTMYGVSKVFSELLGEYHQHRYGTDFRGLRLPSVIGHRRGPGGASAWSSLVVSEPAADRAYRVPVPPDTRMPIIYVHDAVDALLQLAGADAAALRRRTYGVAGFSPTAGELVDAVRAELPGAELEFGPDPHITEIVRSWPERVDGRLAFEDWGWTERYTLAESVRHFVARAGGGRRDGTFAQA